MEPDKIGEFKISQPPTDGISSLRFNPSARQFLLVASWDSTVRLYDVVHNQLRSKFQHDGAVLDCVFSDATQVYTGGLDCSLRTFDLNSGQGRAVGQHDKAIRCVDYSASAGVVITGSWDQTVKLWDPRTSENVGSFSQPERVYAMDSCGERLIVGTASRKVLVWDLRNMGYVQQRRESSLKYQTRCIRSFPNEEGFAISSIEGRVAIEYLDPAPEVQRKKYAFKCHRIREGAVETVYPVNAIAFHHGYNTFATGGSDGYVNIWDGFNKKRLCQFHRYPTTIASLCFSRDGSTLAIATSYLFEDHNVLQKPADDAIYIRSITDQECKPK